MEPAKLKSHSINFSNNFCEVFVKIKSINYSKVVDVAYKSLEVISICFKRSQHPGVILVNVCRDGLDYYWSYKNYEFWKNPLSKSNIDKEVLKTSIQSFIQLKKRETDDHVIDQVFQAVMTKNFHSKKEVIEILKISMEERGLDIGSSEDIETQIKICTKQRPLLKLLANAFYTVGGCGDNVMALKTWGILDLSKVAIAIGRHSRVFQLIVKVGAGTILTAVYSIGFFVTLGDSSYRFIVQIHKLSHVSDEKKNKSFEISSREYL